MKYSREPRRRMKIGIQKIMEVSPFMVCLSPLEGIRPLRKFADNQIPKLHPLLNHPQTHSLISKRR